MKTIFLVRHAKSDWEADYGEDHERPLAGRGRKAARRLGRLVAGSGRVPDRIISSTAVRARTTVQIAAEEGGWGVDIALDGGLYGAGVQTILSRARDLPDHVQSVMFVGHEPGWSHAVSALSGGGSVRMPTACLAQIDFDVETWEDVRMGTGVLQALIPPKALD